MAYRTILYEKKNGIAYVTLNRPERGNAFDEVMGLELIEIWKDIRDDNSVKVVILTGAGDRHFSTGGDMKETAKGWRPNLPRLPEMWKPVIGAINGVVAGGGFHFITYIADFAICVEHATFLEPHVARGIVPVREMLGLATRVPLGEVMRMAFVSTSDRRDAQWALQHGLVTEIVPKERLISRAEELAGMIMQHSQHAIQSTKELLHRAFEVEYAYGDYIQLGRLMEQVRRSPDADEGPKAFSEKRKAQFASVSKKEAVPTA